jgi:predicted Zn-dependent protease
LLQLCLTDTAAAARGAPHGLIPWLLAMAQGQPAQAQAALDQPPGARAFFRDDLLATARRPDAAEPAMQQACRQIALGVLAQRAGLPALAQDIAQQILGQMPALIPAHALRAEALMDRNLSIGPALAAAGKDIADSVLAASLAARAHALAGEYDAATRQYQALLQREPDNDHLRFQLAQIHYAAQRFDDAITCLEPLTGHENPYRSMASNDVAYLLAERHPDKLDQARQIAGDALALAPDNPYLLDTLGWIEHRRGNHRQALAMLCRSLLALPLPQTQEHVAAVYQALGQPGWAEQLRRAARP